MSEDRWWEHPAPGSMLAAMTPEQRAKVGQSMLELRALCVDWSARLARGLTDAEVDQVMGGKRNPGSGEGDAKRA